MAVYIDTPYGRTSHMVADTLGELHTFAIQIGLSRSYFQAHPRHPHYDVWGRPREKAIKLGAKIVSSRELLYHSRLDKRVRKE